MELHVKFRVSPIWLWFVYCRIVIGKECRKRRNIWRLGKTVCVCVCKQKIEEKEGNRKERGNGRGRWREGRGERKEREREKGGGREILDFYVTCYQCNS